MRYGGEEPAQADISSLERVVCAGEVLNAAGLGVAPEDVLARPHPGDRPLCGRPRPAGRCSATRTGIALLPIKPGSAGIPLPGIDAAVVTPEGEPCAPNEKGMLVIRRPFPSLTAEAVGRARALRRATTGSASPGVYYTGDSAHDRRGRLRLGRRAAPTR